MTVYFIMDFGIFDVHRVFLTNWFLAIDRFIR